MLRLPLRVEARRFPCSWARAETPRACAIDLFSALCPRPLRSYRRVVHDAPRSGAATSAVRPIPARASSRPAFGSRFRPPQIDAGGAPASRFIFSRPLAPAAVLVDGKLRDAVLLRPDGAVPLNPGGGPPTTWPSLLRESLRLPTWRRAR